MKFTVDECTGPAVAEFLRGLGYDVFSVYEDDRGISDEEILKRSLAEDRIIITNDKDFGEMIFKGRQKHSGIIFLRLTDERFSNKISVIRRLLQKKDSINFKKFLTVTEKSVRISD